MKQTTKKTKPNYLEVGGAIVRKKWEGQGQGGYKRVGVDRKLYYIHGEVGKELI